MLTNRLVLVVEFRAVLKIGAKLLDNNRPKIAWDLVMTPCVKELVSGRANENMNEKAGTDLRNN